MHTLYGWIIVGLGAGVIAIGVLSAGSKCFGLIHNFGNGMWLGLFLCFLGAVIMFHGLSLLIPGPFSFVPPPSDSRPVARPLSRPSLVRRPAGKVKYIITAVSALALAAAAPLRADPVACSGSLASLLSAGSCSVGPMVFQFTGYFNQDILNLYPDFGRGGLDPVPASAMMVTSSFVDDIGTLSFTISGTATASAADFYDANHPEPAMSTNLGRLYYLMTDTIGTLDGMAISCSTSLTDTAIAGMAQCDNSLFFNDQPPYEVVSSYNGQTSTGSFPGVTTVNGTLNIFNLEANKDAVATWDGTTTLTYDDPIGTVPEPASLFLLGTGLIALGGLARLRLFRASRPVLIEG